jgi:hypothetical protein
VRDYLGVNVIIAALLEIVLAALIAGLAVSRANGHKFSATEAGILIAVSPIFGAFTGALITYFSGLAETLGGRVVRGDAKVRPVDGDPLAARTVWWRSLRAAGLAAVWGVGIGVLVVAMLNRRDAGYPILFVGVVAGGAATAVTGFLGRTEGLRTAFARPVDMQPRPARRRAWRELALPFGLFLAVSNASFTWVLFHDYAVGVEFGTRVLTEQQVLADVPILVLVNVLLAAFICGRAGRAEAAMGLVAFEDEATQVPTGKTGYGIQLLVAVVIAALLVTSLVRFVLPSLPNLAEAMAARALLAGAVAFVAAGFSYIRGAANVAGGAVPVVRPPAEAAS